MIAATEEMLTTEPCNKEQHREVDSQLVWPCTKLLGVHKQFSDYLKWSWHKKEECATVHVLRVFWAALRLST